MIAILEARNSAAYRAGRLSRGKGNIDVEKQIFLRRFNPGRRDDRGDGQPGLRRTALIVFVGGVCGVSLGRWLIDRKAPPAPKHDHAGEGERADTDVFAAVTADKTDEQS
mgnify:CR=1 FL=1